MPTADEILKIVYPNGISNMTFIDEPLYDCPECKDTGLILYNDENGYGYSRQCKCAIKKRALKRIELSGLKDVMDKYTFDAYQARKPWQADAKAKAQAYVENGGNAWFYISGTPGTGKTHLCTAIVGELINKKGKNCRYMIWRESAPRLKANVHADREAYEQELGEFERCDVLYIDDFFKGKITDADVNLAFELLNSRYNSNKATIISGERIIEDVLNIDEAIGSRIYERSKGYRIKTPNENWRLKDG